MLSKPRVESSAGRNLLASTSSASRSRMALVYSVRFNRCSPGAGRCVVGGAIELPFHPRDDRLQGRGVGTPRAGRRHQPGAHLAHHRLGHVHVVAEVREIELIEQQVGRLEPRVVAGHAVLVEQGAGGFRAAAGCRPGRRHGTRSRRHGDRCGGGRRRGPRRGDGLRRPSALPGYEPGPGDRKNACDDRDPVHGEMVTPIRLPEADAAIPAADSLGQAGTVFRRNSVRPTGTGLDHSRGAASLA